MFFWSGFQRSFNPCLYLFAEELEERQMLAGNIEVTFDTGGMLSLIGDDSSNRVELIADGDNIVVRGQGTDLNGTDQEFVFNRASVFDISIQLFDGSDRVTMIAQNDSGFFSTGFGALFCGPNVDPNGTLGIDTGEGNDRVTLIAENTGGVGFFMDLDIDTGGGNDRLYLEASNAGMFGFEAREAFIDTGSGSDRLEFEANNLDGSIGYAITGMDISTGDFPPSNQNCGR